MLEKLGQCAFEPYFLADRFHARFDPRNFGKAEIVDVISLQRQGRRLLDHILIQTFTAFHRRKTNLFARQW